MSIVDFLNHRIAEDEAVARAAGGDEWRIGVSDQRGRLAEVSGVNMTIYDEGGHGPEEAAHIARFDPARMLADCAARRVLVERASRLKVTTYAGKGPFGNLSYEDGRYYDEDGRDITAQMSAWMLVDGEPRDPDTLRTLASVYADHPDFDKAWTVL